ncbi:MAG: glycoside hydrolase family 57, partial [Gammaproteobacteria bacterium]
MSGKLSVVFCWHMHQPFYREADSGRYHLPWVYLHAMKDYTDMAAILRRVPGARSVFNFVPSLMVQIHDYAHQINAWLTGKQNNLPDRLLECLVRSDGYSDDDRHYLLEAGFRLNHERNLHRYPCYSRLYAMAVHVRDQDANLYLGEQFFADLVTWYHIGWLAETVRNEHPVARRLLEKGQNFDQQDRRDLVELIYELLQAIPETYRELHNAG